MAATQALTGMARLTRTEISLRCPSRSRECVALLEYADGHHLSSGSRLFRSPWTSDRRDPVFLEFRSWADRCLTGGGVAGCRPIALVQHRVARAFCGRSYAARRVGWRRAHGPSASRGSYHPPSGVLSRRPAVGLGLGPPTGRRHTSVGPVTPTIDDENPLPATASTGNVSHESLVTRRHEEQVVETPNRIAIRRLHAYARKPK